MRVVLKDLLADPGTSHFGFVHDLLAPVPQAGGSYNVDERETWLERCAEIAPDKAYKSFFELVRSTFPITREVKAEGRLLIGAGNAGGAELGLTVHQAWGVPILPGSALKGLTAHYVDAVYGEDPEWRGPDPDGTLRVPAGAAYRALFGDAPAADGAGGRRGGVAFHDALYVPGAPPFCRDVLTPHQPSYYRGEGSVPPNDWDAPIPVSFITVRPGARFLLAVTGEPGWEAWASRALDLLVAALGDWGVGGKTAAGYGRMVQAAGRS